MLNYYNVDFRLIESIYRTQKTNYIQYANNHVYNFFLSSFMNYAIILISIFDLKLKPCLDTDENVFLFDRKLLLQQQNTYNLVFNIKSITIIEITEMQIVDQYINTKILLSFNKILVQIKIYLINNLQSNFIIDINVLNRDNIDLLLNRKSLRIKNIEILLCYTFLSLTKEFNYYIFYYFAINYTNNFIVDYINNYNVTQSKQRK